MSIRADNLAVALWMGAALFAPAVVAAQAKPAGGWRPLFDGKSLAGWNVSEFFGAGKVAVEKGVIVIGSGALTGINWAGSTPPFPTTDYEVRVEAARLRGSDFFAGITFPVRDSYCTWINGGWGGDVVGLSSLDGADALSNETSFARTFERGRWYSLQLSVTASAITAWIDEERVIDVDIGKKYVALREGDIDKSVPFGIATYATAGAVRKIEWRPLGKAHPTPP